MENSNWKDDLRKHFKNHQISSITDKIEEVSKALNEWVNFVKEESNLKINESKLNLRELKSELEITGEKFQFPLKIQVILDSFGESILIKSSNGVYVSDKKQFTISDKEPIETFLKFSDDMKEELTKILINYEYQSC
jgi:hypothetical protein